MTPINPPEVQRTVDAEQLRLLRVGYFISAGYTAFFALIGLFYVSMGFFFSAMLRHLARKSGVGPPPEFFGYLFGAIGLGMATMAGTAAALKLRVARCLRLRTSHGFCVFVAVLTCLEVPYGTALGILTCIALNRPSVRNLFRTSPYPQPGLRDPNVT